LTVDAPSDRSNCRTQVTDVVLTRSSSGVIEVRWTVAGDCREVDVTWGDVPNALHHRRKRRVRSVEQVTHIDFWAKSRLFVSVAPADEGCAVVGAERKLQFAGAPNFSDLGGYITADSRRVRWGLIYRSGAAFDGQ
jgi:hypothetical protein